MGLLYVLSYVAALVAFVFITLSLGMSYSLYSWEQRSHLHPCLASGLLWVAEMIEEHSRMAKIIGQRAIWVRTKEMCFWLTIDLKVSTGDYGNARHLIFWLASTFISYLFDLMSRRIFKEHHVPLASHFAVITNFYPLLLAGIRGSLPLV